MGRDSAHGILKTYWYVDIGLRKRMSQEMDFKLTSGPWNFNYLSWELASHHHKIDWYLMNKTVKDFQLPKQYLITL